MWYLQNNLRYERPLFGLNQPIWFEEEYFDLLPLEANSGSYQTSKTELFKKMVNSLKPFTINFEKPKLDKLMGSWIQLWPQGQYHHLAITLTLLFTYTLNIPILIDKTSTQYYLPSRSVF